MPQIKLFGRRPLRHIGGQPRHQGSPISKTAARFVQRSRGDIENGDIGPSLFDKAIDDTRRAASGIDDSRLLRQAGVLDQGQRSSWMVLVPTDLSLGLALVFLLSVRLPIHVHLLIAIGAAAAS